MAQEVTTLTGTAKFSKAEAAVCTHLPVKWASRRCGDPILSMKLHIILILTKNLLAIQNNSFILCSLILYVHKYLGHITHVKCSWFYYLSSSNKSINDVYESVCIYGTSTHCTQYHCYHCQGEFQVMTWREGYWKKRNQKNNNLNMEKIF